MEAEDEVVSQETEPPAQLVPDMQPFGIDPLIYGHLKSWRISPLITTLLTVAAVGIAATWVTAVQGRLYRTSNSAHWWLDFCSFLLRHRRADRGSKLNLFSDYPSIILAATIALSFGLIYALLTVAEKLHSTMEQMGCISFADTRSQTELSNAITSMNIRFAQIGGKSRPVFLLCFTANVGINLLLQRDLYSFSALGNRYDVWWASLHPFRWGSIIWLFVGTLGSYSVYVEIVLGLTYVRFLRTCRDHYRFRPNIFNPDQFYGWAAFRSIISNLEAGVILTFLSCFALTYYFPSAIGNLLTVFVLTAFASVVLWVFWKVTSGFRRQVKYDKMHESMKIQREVDARNSSSELIDQLVVLNNFHRLRLISAVPNSPIRAAWLVAGAVTILIPILVIVFEIVPYVAPRH